MSIRTKQNKLEYMVELSHQTAHDISRNAEHWRDFLVTATNLYKYEFHEQLLIHTQRPDATACAELETWNKRMNRYVNKGAKGIALIDDSGDTLRLRYVFDVSDTHSARNNGRSRTPYQWQITNENADSVVDALNRYFDVDSKYLADSVPRIAERLVAANLNEYLDDLMYSRSDSFLEDMDRVNIRKNFRELMINSVEYCIYTRCGYDADEYVPLENFGDVCDFNTLNTITALGTAVSEMSEEILRQIEKSVKEFDLQRRKELYNGLQRGQRILAPADRDGGADDIGQVRAASQAAPTEISQGDIQSAPNVGAASQASDRNTADSGETRGTDNREPVTENAATAENGADEVGTAHELNSDNGGGSDTERTDLRLDYFDRSTEDRSLPFLHDDNIIKEMLRTSPYLSASREEIADFYNFHADATERTEYIRNIFNNDYTELLIGEDNNHRVGYKTYQNVLHLWEGSYLNRTSQGYYDWGVIAQYYSAMMLLDEFLDTPAVSQRAQLSLFDPEPTEIKPNTFEFNQKIIDAVLCRGSGVDGGKLRIYKQFTESMDMSENEKFLRNEYGTGGAMPVIVGTDISEWHDSGGIRLMSGETELKLTWRNVATRIGELIREDSYLTEAEKAKYEQEQTEFNDEVSKQAEYEPWYDNFLQLKSEHEDELLLLRMGDFYELFGDDALHAAEVLELTITHRDNGIERVSVCGFPNHTLEQYVDRLVQHDFKVAVTDLTADNSRSTGEYIPREVVALYSKNGIENDIQLPGQHEVAEAEVSDVPTVPMPDNFHITDMHLGTGGAKTKFRNNVEAIKTLQLIERENRYATPEEQEILSRYVGWGGISQAFDSTKPDWSNEYEELKSLLSDDEYSAARATTLSSFYTSPTVISAIYTALSDMGFERGNVLEPSCGTGNFFGLLPEEMKQAKLYGVELDSITGRIAKQLYPHADIQVTGYEKSELQDNFFDVVIGNVPFGNYKVADNKYNKLNYNIHNYFIKNLKIF